MRYHNNAMAVAGQLEGCGIQLGRVLPFNSQTSIGVMNLIHER